MPGVDPEPLSPRAPLGRLPAGKAVATASRARLLTSNITVESLRPHVRKFVEENARVLQPDGVYICDGSEEENKALLGKLEKSGRIAKLKKYENW